MFNRKNTCCNAILTIFKWALAEELSSRELHRHGPRMLVLYGDIVINIQVNTSIFVLLDNKDPIFHFVQTRVRREKAKLASTQLLLY